MGAERPVHVRGTGRVSVAAYGIADAEHLVEKEITRALPDARVLVTDVHRAGESRIVEEFAVEYRIDLPVAVREADPEKAKGAAFRHARALLSGTRYRLTAWEVVSPRAS